MTCLRRTRNVSMESTIFEYILEKGKMKRNQLIKEIGPAIFSPMKALNNLNWDLGSVKVTFFEKRSLPKLLKSVLWSQLCNVYYFY